MPTQAELKVKRRKEKERELEKRRKEAEKAVGATTGTLSDTAKKIKARNERLKNI